MHRHLREKIEESLETKILSKNLILLSMARLCEKIKTSEQNQVQLKKQRDIIASAALKNDIGKAEIISAIKTIDKSDYPTYNTISRIVELCQEGYEYQTDFIPDRWIHHKYEMNGSNVGNQIFIENDKQEELNDLLNFIRKEFLGFELTEQMKGELLGSINDRYSLAIVVKAFKYHARAIKDAQRGKAFMSLLHQFRFVLKTAKNFYEDEFYKEQRQKEIEEHWEYVDTSASYRKSMAQYQRKTVDTGNRFKDYARFEKAGAARWRSVAVRSS